MSAWKLKKITTQARGGALNFTFPFEFQICFQYPLLRKSARLNGDAARRTAVVLSIRCRDKPIPIDFNLSLCVSSEITNSQIRSGL
ncbi:unnamed protein product [Victoria cruziana]